jgi:hypothetical protein
MLTVRKWLFSARMSEFSRPIGRPAVRYVTAEVSACRHLCWPGKLSWAWVGRGQRMSILLRTDPHVARLATRGAGAGTTQLFKELQATVQGAVGPVLVCSARCTR